jgi:hypothetical protein
MNADERRRGSALVIVLILMVVVVVLCLATLALVASEVRSATVARQRTQALFVAEAGVERQIAVLRDILRKVSITDPFPPIDRLAGTTPFVEETLTKDGTSVGQFTVQVLAVESPDSWTRDVTIRSRGCVPSARARNQAARVVTAVVRVRLDRSQCFDFAYLVDNWGYFFRDTISVDGNVGSNGVFDCGRYRPTLYGFPRFETVVGTDLQGYIEEDGDGNRTNDGVIYAGWTISAANVRGTANDKWTQGDAAKGLCDPSQVGQFKNQHEFCPRVPMPNLSDLTPYEEIAKGRNSSISIGGTVVCGPVLGDDAGEKQNLYLRGTAASPIVLNGPVVVRGSVIISGVVQGQGSIYAGGNVYVPQDLLYNTKPQPLPTGGSRNESELENWLAKNQGCDQLGLFARQHIVVGDYTNATWRSEVDVWLKDPRNMSREDAGLDFMPNTRAGRDGLLGTLDDDVLEGDGVWTVDRYTQEDADVGLIPAGKQVGDVIPGSGEDVDGDGVYDGQTTLVDFNLPAPLESANWAGNAPATATAYSAVSTLAIAELDATLGTNHDFAMYSQTPKDHIEILGCLVSRNESIVYSAHSLSLNYDYRLMGRGGLTETNVTLPKSWMPIKTLMWTSD